MNLFRWTFSVLPLLQIYSSFGGETRPTYNIPDAISPNPYVIAVRCFHTSPCICLLNSCIWTLPFNNSHTVISDPSEHFSISHHLNAFYFIYQRGWLLIDPHNLPSAKPLPINLPCLYSFEAFPCPPHSLQTLHLYSFKSVTKIATT